VADLEVQFMQKYAIIDVETTGGAARNERITEIAIVVHDGEKVLETFSTLINPERQIPWNITRITGISNEMVTDAPKFFEVAKQIVQLTENAIFIAHNVRFDYEFIREEFMRLGYSYSRKRLCTVQMSRKVFPGLKSYSLSSLKAHFGIYAERSHRALDDTLATVQLFELILARSNEGSDVKGLKQFIAEGIKLSKLPKSMTLEELEALPDRCGVYYFHNAHGEVIYVGKSIDIRKRIFEHFADVSKKTAIMQDQTHSITYQLTGSELAALLLESAEIKRILPPINRAQRIRTYQSAIYSYLDQGGYRRFINAPNSPSNRIRMELLAEYPKMTSARGHLESLARLHQLCPQFCHLEPPGGACFQYHIKKCKGACLGVESAEDYNIRANVVKEILYKELSGDFLVIEQGAAPEENYIIGVQEGRYLGMGIFEKEWMPNDPLDVLDSLKTSFPDPEAERIIRNYLLKNKPKMVALSV
jgi:DNA polymerase III subunit epsilon